MPAFTTAMLALLLLAAYAIDEESGSSTTSPADGAVDAAVLAAAQNFQYPCEPGGTDQKIAGNSSNSMTAPLTTTPRVLDNIITAVVPVALTTSSTYSEGQHNLFSRPISPRLRTNRSPAKAIWRKTLRRRPHRRQAHETNLPSFFPFVNPKYINAQARVNIKKLTRSTGGELPRC